MTSRSIAHFVGSIRQPRRPSAARIRRGAYSGPLASRAAFAGPRVAPLLLGLLLLGSLSGAALLAGAPHSHATGTAVMTALR